MALDSAVLTALQGPSVRQFCAIQIQLSNSTVAMIDGSGTVTFGGVTYTSPDPYYGSIMSISTVTEAVATEAPSLQVQLAMPTTGSIGTLGDMTQQGSPFLLYFGLLDEASGSVIGTPELLYSGFIDTVKITSAMNQRVIELEISSMWEALFRPNDGARLNEPFWSTVWPNGAGGLVDAVSAALVDPVWGASAQTPTIVPQMTPGASGSVVNYNGSGSGYRG